MTYLLRFSACLFLCVSLNSFGAISYSGVITSINDPTNLLSTDLGFNNTQVGDSYNAYFNFGNPTVTFGQTSSVEPDYQVYMFNDPYFNASISFLNQPTINSVSAMNFSNVYVAIAQDTIIETGVTGDAYIVQAEVTDNIWMVLQLGDSSGTALSSESFYPETSLEKWDIQSVYLQHIEFNPSFTEVGLLVSSNEVPLPAGIYLFLSGLVGLGLMRVRNNLVCVSRRILQ